MNLKPLCKDSKYTYGLNITTNWVYRKLNNQSDNKYVAYDNNKTFMTHDAIRNMYRK